MLRRGFTAEVSSTARAFECPRCEAVIYEDEFTLGKFVPPQFRARSEALLSIPSSTSEDLPSHIDPPFFTDNKVAQG
jgi:hypothetical protein